jgi:PPOX class probable F420-dependent enzyme
MPTPTATRPHIPGYGIAPADEGEGLLPWSWAEERLAASRGYWVATTRPDGRPHCTPVWGVWVDGAVWFSAGAKTVKARNLAADPRCSVTVESSVQAVIVEGRVELSDPHPQAVIDRYEAKYPMGFPPGEPLYRLAPEMVLAFIDEGDRFGTTATRWRFD